MNRILAFLFLAAAFRCHAQTPGLAGHPGDAGMIGLTNMPGDVQTVVLDLGRQGQQIDNIGASACWFSESIGKYWPKEKKEQIAEWLFSREMDVKGNPKGVGMSVFRYNIGGGTAEQGDSSGIKMVPRRVECFQRPDGTYDWSKQEGYLWFVRKAKQYGVEQLIAFSNTPPVHMTINGYGYKTVKDYGSNLAADKYGAYAGFLADVLKHFDSEGLHFDYISPVNEPQWAWTDKPGEAGQEGSSWKNEEIRHVVSSLDSALGAQRLSSKILVTEAGQLNYLYGGSGVAARQIQTFFGADAAVSAAAGVVSPVGPGGAVGAVAPAAGPGGAAGSGSADAGSSDANARPAGADANVAADGGSHLPRLIGGHSYFTESSDSTLVEVRRKLADTARAYNVGFWETEYSMLADGFRDGAKGSRSAMDCALFLAKVMYADLAIANAKAWQFWNAYEPGKADSNTRYYLVALKPDKDYKDGDYAATKNLWVLGNYSRWVRPGMHRILTDASAVAGGTSVRTASAGQASTATVGAAAEQETLLRALSAVKTVMVSAYTDGRQVVVVAVNYTGEKQLLDLQLKHGPKVRNIRSYVTSAKAGDDLKYYPVALKGPKTLAARSVTTFVIDGR